jgi:hypothetical protein
MAGYWVSNTSLLWGVDFGLCLVVFEVWLVELRKLIMLLGDGWARYVW